MLRGEGNNMRARHKKGSVCCATITALEFQWRAAKTRPPLAVQEDHHRSFRNDNFALNFPRDYALRRRGVCGGVVESGKQTLCGCQSRLCIHPGERKRSFDKHR